MDKVTQLFGLVSSIITANSGLRTQVGALSSQVADLQKENASLKQQLDAATQAVVAVPPPDPTAVPASALQPSIDALTEALHPTS